MDCGKLIVLYGINNLGKTTQAKLLVEKMKKAGYPAEYLKYPLYDLEPSGRILNDYLRGKNTYDLSARESQIINVLNRTQYDADLREKLNAGTNIVAEDYIGTGIAWGMGAGVKQAFLEKINEHLRPEDLVFYFSGERFKEATEPNHRHETDDRLLDKVKAAHDKLAQEYGWTTINANLTIEEISDAVWQRVQSELA